MVIKDIYPGDILKIEKEKALVFVVSKKYFNDSGGVIGCPIVSNVEENSIHVYVEEKDVEGIVLCEQLKFFDLNIRGYKVVARSCLESMVNIVDIVQGFFDF